MASTITADNGVSSGSAGLKSSADSSGVLALATGTGTTAVTIDSSQRVGIGTASPTNNLTIGNGGGGNDLGVSLSRGATTNFYEAYDGTKTMIVGTDASNAYIKLGTLSAHPVALVQGNGIAAYIDTSKNFLVGTTSVIGAGKISVQFEQAASRGISLQNTNSTNTGTYLSFYNSSGTQQGYITQTNSSTTQYATSSDYRLKNNPQPMTGALSVVQQLKPCTYTWKVDGSNGQGFIAHELQAVVPDCVTGEKDAVETVDIKDEEGNIIGTEERPIYQGIDTSFLVATLTAAIQEQQALINNLTERLAVLEAK